jgi:transposase
MASIIKKTNKGRVYYYAVKSQRVDGKPRIVWQKYLGTIEDIISKASSNASCSVSEVDIFETGGIAAMLKIADALKIIEIINEIVPKRDQGPSVGHYILLASINRIFAPCSKLQMDEWYKQSVLYRLWKYPPESFSSQNFWNHMELITEEHISKIQEKIALRLKSSFNIRPDMFLYDTTNFFSYIATGNRRNTIAKRGRNKNKRDDLRQVGLAMLVTREFQIPLFHKTYEGNQPDRSLFIETSSEITDFQKKVFGGNKESTLVFDKGNISEDAIEKLIISKQPFVCAIPKTTIGELFEVDVDKMACLQDLPGTCAYSHEVEIWHTKLKAVVAYSASFFAAELAELSDGLRKCEQQLQDLQKWLLKGPSAECTKHYYTVDAVKAKIARVNLSGHVKDIIDIKLSTNEKIPRLQYKIDQKRLDQITRTKLGRTVLVTTHSSWSDSEVIVAYRSQQNIEAAFKLMKNREYLHWQPTFHWTDEKIKVHGLYCVLALLQAALAHKTVVEAGVDVTLLQMLEELSGIREVAIIYTGAKNVPKRKDELVLSRLSPTQKKLSEILGIHEVLAH